MKKILGTILSVFLVSIWTGANAALFIAAHPDDVVLLMGGNALNDIKSNYPTQVIIITAGDANNGNLPDAHTGYNQYNRNNNPYYRVRLLAQEAAMNVWVPSSYPRPFQRTTESFSAQIPAVEKAYIGNLTIYYLNLPDGSLQNFYSAPVTATLKDVEGVNEYTPASLKEVIRQIISRNNHNTPSLVVNYQEYNPEFSSPGYNEQELKDGVLVYPAVYYGDHTDHRFSGYFVKDAIEQNQAYWCLAQGIYMGYAAGATPDNMPVSWKQLQEQGYWQLHVKLVEMGNITYYESPPGVRIEQEGAWDDFHRGFIGKQRWRGGQLSPAACSF